MRILFPSHTITNWLAILFWSSLIWYFPWEWSRMEKWGKIVDTGIRALTKRKCCWWACSSKYCRKVKQEKIWGNRRICRKSFLLITTYPLCPNTTHSSSFAPKVLLIFTSENGQEIDSGYPKSNRRKRTKMYHSFPMTYTRLLLILIRNNKIFVIPTKLRNLLIQKDTIPMPVRIPW